MRAVKVLFVGHLAALVFGLGGLLIALPHPELWAGSPVAGQVFAFGIRYAGSLHILFGAATMLLFGLLYVGWRKTLIFFVAATTISLSMELLGTGTGFPFGAYSYTDFLGFKVMGRVPYSIPLSWFYMGFASYLLASAITAALGLRLRTLWSLGLGVYFLTVWDLALDPAMAAQNLPVHFWVWHLTGPYFGMPIRNLVGWSLTGLTFMTVSRLLWRQNVATDRLPIWLPYGIYAANTGFAIALNIGAAGLWLPPVMSVILGLVPATFALRLGRTKRPQMVASGGIAERAVQRVMRTGARALQSREADVSVEGLEHMPASGPVLIAARHFHHLYDGCALQTAVTRPIHILVALDWVRTRAQRRLMEWACAAARWPVVLRSERLHADEAAGGSVFAMDEGRRYLRRAVADAVTLLRAGEALVVFPEAYPNIDPSFTPKRGEDDFLPFRPGFVRIAQLAQRDGWTHVPIVPAGLVYTRAAEDRWQIALRFGPAITVDQQADADQLALVVEQQVRMLSQPASRMAVEALDGTASIAREVAHP